MTLNPFDSIIRTDIESILTKALAKGGDFSEIFIEERTGTVISSEAGRIEKFNIISDFGIGLRVVDKDRSGYAYTNDIEAVKELASTVAASFGANQGAFPIQLKTRPSRNIRNIAVNASTVDAKKKIELIKRAEKVVLSGGSSVVQAKAMFADSSRKIFIANSKGYSITDFTDSVIFYVQCVVSDGHIMETGYEPVGGTLGFELFNGEIAEETAQTALKRALQSLKAANAPAGVMPVVLSSKAGGTMVHEAIGHGLEADFAGQGLSVYSNRLGEQVASKAISVIDDGTLAGRRGSFGYDDEGTPSQRTVLVENGILKSYLTDMITASRYGLELTGNGRRETFRHRPVPRMTNTLIQQGEMNPDDIVRMVDKGLFVKKMGGGQVNPITGDFVFEVSEGYIIDKGSIGEALRGATLIGNGPKILMSIEYVGNDIGWGMGTCGKDGQGVPVGDAQPTILIPEITVGGKINVQ